MNVFQGNGFSMFIILPNEISGLQKLEEALAKVNLTDELNNLRRLEVIVSLPKFEITQTIDLKSVLQSVSIILFSFDFNYFFRVMVYYHWILICVFTLIILYRSLWI